MVCVGGSGGGDLEGNSGDDGRDADLVGVWIPLGMTCGENICPCSVQFC